MRKINDQKIYRVIDANFNRAKEGLRVCEDICRFILDERVNTKKYKKIRHELTTVVSLLKISKIIESREIEKDIGRASIAVELKRKEVTDIFYANSQRVKESLRVLEEFTKLLNKSLCEDVKKLRYSLYALEKKTLREFDIE